MLSALRQLHAKEVPHTTRFESAQGRHTEDDSSERRVDIMDPNGCRHNLNPSSRDTGSSQDPTPKLSRHAFLVIGNLQMLRLGTRLAPFCI